MAPSKSKKAPSRSSTNFIAFQSVDIPFVLKQKTLLRDWINTCIHKEKKTPGVLSFNFCSDKHLLSVNREFLDHDYYTDIITFNLNDGEEISGDIYISIDRVKENARSVESTFHVELLRVMIHGVLHLCGYNDKTKKEIATMRKKEDECLSLLP